MPEQVDSTSRCKLTSEYYVYSVHEGNEKFVRCLPCRNCSKGKGLEPECGRRIREDAVIKCKRCIKRKTYSDKIGTESCKSCDDCGNRLVLRNCTRKYKQICAKTICRRGYYFDGATSSCQTCSRCCEQKEDLKYNVKARECAHMPDNLNCKVMHYSCSPKTSQAITTTRPVAGAPALQDPAAGNLTTTFSPVATTGAPTLDDVTTGTPSTGVLTEKAQATQGTTTGNLAATSTTTGAATVDDATKSTPITRVLTTKAQLIRGQATGPPTFVSLSTTTGTPTVNDATAGIPSTGVLITKDQAKHGAATSPPTFGSSNTSTGSLTVDDLTTGTQNTGTPPVEAVSTETEHTTSSAPKTTGIVLSIFVLLVVVLAVALAIKYNRRKVAVSTVDEKRLTSEEKSDKPLLASHKLKSSDCKWLM